MKFWSCTTLLLLEHVVSYYCFKMNHTCWFMKARLCWCYLIFKWVFMRTEKKHSEKSCKEQYLCSFPSCSSHTVFEQWFLIQQPSLNTVIERGSRVMMSNGTVSLKPCSTNLAFITQLLSLARSHKPGIQFSTYSLFLPHQNPLFSPASRIERILLISMCWTMYFIFLNCTETEHSSANKYEATCKRRLPSSEGKQMCSEHCQYFRFGFSNKTHKAICSKISGHDNSLCIELLRQIRWA